MEFLKINEYWTYQLPEWDNYDREDIEETLEEIDSITDVNYSMAPDVDLWTITYKECKFTIANDIAHGCEIRATSEADLAIMEELIKKFDF